MYHHRCFQGPEKAGGVEEPAHSAGPFEEGMMRTGGKVLTLLLGIMTTIALTGTPVHAATTSTDFQPQIAYYLVISQLSGKCLDLNGGSQDDGAAIIQWSCHGAVNQQWRATLKGKG